MKVHPRRGIVARQQRICDLRDKAKKGGVEGRVARHLLSQARGEGGKPI